jgi:hypothetical protein
MICGPCRVPLGSGNGELQQHQRGADEESHRGQAQEEEYQRYGACKPHRPLLKLRPLAFLTGGGTSMTHST